VLAGITGRSRVKGDDGKTQDPVYTVLDMVIRPQPWATRSIVEVDNAPLRLAMAAALEEQLPEIAASLRDDGRLTLMQWENPQVQAYLVQQQSRAAFQAQAIGQAVSAADALKFLLSSNVVP